MEVNMLVRMLLHDLALSWQGEVRHAFGYLFAKVIKIGIGKAYPRGKLYLCGQNVWTLLTSY